MIDDSVVFIRHHWHRTYLLIIAGAIATALLLKSGLILAEVVPFNADEAIVALMARHILSGEKPIFFYGQAYMGSLDAHLVALGFAVFGEEVWVVRLVQIILYLGTILTSSLILWKVTGSRLAAAIGAWLLAIPSVNLTLYTTISLGGYGEMLLIGNLILLMTLQIVHTIREPGRSTYLLTWFGLGFLTGLGLWTFALSLVYALPAISYIAWDYHRRSTTAKVSWKVATRHPFNVFAAVIGGIIGAFPWLWYASQFGLDSLVGDLARGAILGIEGLNGFNLVIHRLFNLAVLGGTVIFGLRPPWEVQWLALPVIPMAIFCWNAVLIFAMRVTISEMRTPDRFDDFSHAPLFSGVLLTLGGGFLLTRFGGDPSGRYFLPVNVILILFAAMAVSSSRRIKSRWALFFVSFILIFNLWGIIQTAAKNPPGLTTQLEVSTQIDHRYDEDLIDFLSLAGERQGYTNYWVAYPLAFLSGEELIYLPVLPYHKDLHYNPRDNRYPPYRAALQGASRVAYITTHHPDLDKRLRDGFLALDISWKEVEIGDYHVFYQISKCVDPVELGLGMDF